MVTVPDLWLPGFWPAERLLYLRSSASMANRNPSQCCGADGLAERQALLLCLRRLIIVSSVDPGSNPAAGDQKKAHSNPPSEIEIMHTCMASCLALTQLVDDVEEGVG